MAERLTLRLFEPAQAHKAMGYAWKECVKPMLMAGHDLVMEVKPKTRSLEQNARLWAMLGDISEQVEWYGRKLSPESWKHVFTAALSKQDVVPGIDGGFVVLGKSTSRMTKAEMSELQTLMEAFGAEKNVRFKASLVDHETGEIT